MYCEFFFSLLRPFGVKQGTLEQKNELTQGYLKQGYPSIWKLGIKSKIRLLKSVSTCTLGGLITLTLQGKSITLPSTLFQGFTLFPKDSFCSRWCHYLAPVFMDRLSRGASIDRITRILYDVQLSDTNLSRLQRIEWRWFSIEWRAKSRRYVLRDIALRKNRLAPNDDSSHSISYSFLIQIGFWLRGVQP
jgi:hypothetical protein